MSVLQNVNYLNTQKCMCTHIQRRESDTRGYSDVDAMVEVKCVRVVCVLYLISLINISALSSSHIGERCLRARGAQWIELLMYWFHHANSHTHRVICVYVYFIMIMDGRSATAAAAYSQLLLCVGVCGFCSAALWPPLRPPYPELFSHIALMPCWFKPAEGYMIQKISLDQIFILKW
jgi:hypothetical protein